MHLSVRNVDITTMDKSRFSKEKNMSKRSSYIVNTGQLEGANLKIVVIHNNGLQESLTILNRGTVVQPMSGWVLASLRGQVFYSFPDDLILYANMIAIVHSGQQELQNAPTHHDVWRELFWTTDQVWNNHGDIAILFDANGLEIDRFSYPHERVLGSSAKRQKVLLRNDDGYEIVSEALLRAKKVTRKRSGALAGQP
jgi:hypothetical protein